MSPLVKSFFRGGIIDAEWKRVPPDAKHDGLVAIACGSGRSGCTTTPSNSCCSSTQVASRENCCGSDA